MDVPRPQQQSRNPAKSHARIEHHRPDDISLRSLAVTTSLPASYAESGDELFPSTKSSARPVGRPHRSIQPILSWREPVSLHTLIFAGHLLLTLCPSLFLILSFSAWVVNNDPVGSLRGQTVEQAARLGPTLFPIIFAAVCSRLMRTYALWRAEKGETLGILEQMSGSQNLLAAVERAILIPGLGFTSTGIVLLWLLSPIGGQSSLRVLGRGVSVTTGEAPLYYFNTSGFGGGSVFQGSSAFGTFENGLNAVFKAALTSLERVKGRDTWGNVRIPVLDYIDDRADIDNCVGFDENQYHEPYTALNGLIISGLTEGADYNFTLESSYFNLTCTGPAFMPMNEFMDYAGPLMYHRSNAPWVESDWNSYVVDTNYNQTANYNHIVRADPQPVYNIIYASLFGNGSSSDWVFAVYNCTVCIRYVESDLRCSGKSCEVRRIRPSRKFGPSDSGWPWATLSGAPLANMFIWMGRATSMTRSGGFSAIDAYISGSNTPFDIHQDVNYQNVTANELGKRLQNLLNTCWQLGYQGSATAQEPCRKQGPDYPIAWTMATTVTTRQIFVVHWAWLAVNIVASFILLFCGISGMVFKYKSHAPDIFGFVSSMTRDNPNFENLPGGDKMEGLERARAMRYVHVQIVDAAPWGEGHITLKNVDPLSTSYGRTIQ